jgi:hypothetical protein
MGIRSKIYLFAALIFTGCHKNDVNLQVVTHTSEYLYCDKVFAANRKSIIELNEILLQTGSIDTIEDKTVKAAVINISNEEKILDLEKTYRTGKKITEIYSGKGYKLILNYEPAGDYYTGDIQVFKGQLYSKFAIEGSHNIL